MITYPNQAISAGAQSTQGTVIFSNSNGLTFGLNNGTLTGSYTVPIVPAQTEYLFSNSNGVSFGTNGSTVTASHNGLTTAALSNHSHNFATTTTNGSLVVVATTNSAGATIAVPAYLTTAQAPGAYLTTARASNDAIGLNSAITQNGVSMTANSSGLSLNFPAFLTTAALSNHSHNFATTTTNGASIIVATTNSNGATIAVPAYLTTAQPVGVYLTTARASNDAVGLNTALTANGVAWTVNSSGLSLNVPAFLTTAQPVGAYLTTARASNDAVGLNTAQSNVTWTVNSSGISINAAGYAGTGLSLTNATATLNSNGLQLSVGGGGVTNQTGPNIAAGTQTATSGTVVFANSNQVTFGMSGSSQITASFNPINIGMSTNGNTAGTTGIFDGAGLEYILVGGSNITLSQSSNGASVSLSIIGKAPQTASTYIPYYPASTGVQTLGAQGVTSASAFFFPLSIQDAVMFNQIQQLMTASWISTTVAASNTITHQFGLFTNNAGTLSLISSSSYSVAASNSSISATVSYPSAYGTAGGYTYTTVGASSTATAQSLFGTAGNRVMTFGFGNTMELSAGLYFLGIHQRQSSAGAAAGMAFALAGNIMGAAASVGALGSSTAAYTGTNATLLRVPWGVATSTGSAGYGGSQLPSAVNITAMGMTVTNMPMMTFISR